MIHPSPVTKADAVQTSEDGFDRLARILAARPWNHAERNRWRISLAPRRN